MIGRNVIFFCPAFGAPFTGPHLCTANFKCQNETMQ